MTKAVRFTRAELESAARISREHELIIKLTRDGDLLMFPDIHKVPTIDRTLDEELDAELAAFEAKHGGG